MIGLTTKILVSSHRALFEQAKLWRSTFWVTWDHVPFTEKIAWIAFVGQTTAVITLLEYFLLRK